MEATRLLPCITYIVALCIYMQGFLPLKETLPGYSNNSWQDFHPDCDSRKVIIIVVDALRTDFISNNENYWPYMHRLISEKRAHIFNARVHPPTVTLPRIKAMMSGDVPGFVDVIMNFNSQQLTSDNVLYQLRSSGRSAVFYGDDTWLKLFPSMFLRSEGTTSFFVSDYTEVDNNVTRHIDKELSNLDWSVMILHYLGLDHIGHLIGPFSELVPPKLQEMDRVVERIDSTLHKQRLSNYLIVLCGDHGMADQGGHGGVTPNEVNIPLVFITDSKADKIQYYDDVYQIDLVPTLSILLNLPIPQNNLGVIIPELLITLLGHEYTLEAVADNSHQVATLLKRESNKQNGELLSRLERLTRQRHILFNLTQPPTDRIQNLINDYMDLLMEMRKTLTSRLITYDVEAMVVGFSLTFLILLSLLIQPSFNVTYQSLGISAVISGVVLSLYTVRCTSSQPSSVLCTGITGQLTGVLGVISLSKILASLFSGMYMRGCNYPHLVTTTTVTSAILHSTSLLASSFIEEEHQIAYFFSTTLVYIIFIYTLTSQPTNKKAVAYLALCLILMSITRKWNQTGDKWSHLTDIADIVNQSEWLTVRVILATFSILISIVISLPSYYDIKILVFSIISAVSTTLFVIQDSDWYSLSYRGVIEANVLYMSVAFIFTMTMWRFYSSSYSTTYCMESLRLCWVLLTSLLHKTVNIPLLCANTLIESCLFKSISYSKVNQLAIITYYWLAQASYFYQGNSNGLSSVDVSAGYKGMLSYNPAITGLLMFFNTYSGPVYWILSIAVFITRNFPERYYSEFREFSTLYYTMKLADVTVLLFLIIVERYHLFVWTVFAPKLLYELFAMTLYNCVYIVFS